MKRRRGRRKSLDKEQIGYVKYLRENGISIRGIAKAFNVSHMAVWRCLR